MCVATISRGAVVTCWCHVRDTHWWWHVCVMSETLGDT